MARTVDFDIVFIDYDEPRRDEFWRDLKHKAPHARRVSGVTGFDRAHKAAAALADGPHFITVDADCIVEAAFLDLVIDDDLLRPTTRIEWPSRNLVNGVVSTNGAITCWPRALVETMRSHECAAPDRHSIDFPVVADLSSASGPFRVEAVAPMATVHCNGSPLQAFRCGFREAVRLCVSGRSRPDAGPPADRLHPLQRHRLLLWCSLGADVDNGCWCIYGARLATTMLHRDDWSHGVINDFAWFDDVWREDIAPRFMGDAKVCRHTGFGWNPAALECAIRGLGAALREDLGLEVAELGSEHSRLLKRLYEPPISVNAFDRQGTMFDRGLGVGSDDAKAARAYRAAAAVGHAGALYNRARLELAGGGAEDAVARLREASALGSAYAAHRLGRLHRRGDIVPRDPGRAVELLHLAAGRGFALAHRDLGEMYEAGDGVGTDLVRAREHYVRANDPDLKARIAEIDRRLACASQPVAAEAPGTTLPVLGDVG